jgi:hypothetical protein
LVKKALEEQVLMHYKTLIVYQDREQDMYGEEERRRLVKEAKQRVIQLLVEKPEGITLA